MLSVGRLYLRLCESALRKPRRIFGAGGRPLKQRKRQPTKANGGSHLGNSVNRGNQCLAAIPSLLEGACREIKLGMRPVMS